MSADEDPPPLLAEAFEVRYHGGPQPAVQDVDLELRRGEVLLIAGDAGAGKTSLVRGLLGLVTWGGAARVWGRPPGDRAANRRVGYAPQARGFAQGLTARETVTLALRLRGHGPAAAAGALERAGIAHAARLLGERLGDDALRRLGLAVATAGDPPLLVLDDPPAVPEARREIARARAEGRAVLVAARDGEGLGPVDRQLLLVEGQPG